MFYGAVICVLAILPATAVSEVALNISYKISNGLSNHSIDNPENVTIRIFCKVTGSTDTCNDRDVFTLVDFSRRKATTFRCQKNPAATWQFSNAFVAPGDQFMCGFNGEYWSETLAVDVSKLRNSTSDTEDLEWITPSGKRNDSGPGVPSISPCETCASEKEGEMKSLEYVGATAVAILVVLSVGALAYISWNKYQKFVHSAVVAQLSTTQSSVPIAGVVRTEARESLVAELRARQEEILRDIGPDERAFM